MLAEVAPGDLSAVKFQCGGSEVTEAAIKLARQYHKLTGNPGKYKIINIGSMYSFFGSGLIPSYSAAKGAIVQLTKSMAIELAPHNIQVNAIAPGWIETDMTAPVKSMPLNAEILSRTPAGRWGQPEEVAGTAVFLASRASDFVTGAIIPVDGGYAIR